MTAPALSEGCGLHVYGGVQMHRRFIPFHSRYLHAYASGQLAAKGQMSEAYLSLYTFKNAGEVEQNLAAHRGFLADFNGLHGCQWLILDIDRPDLSKALNDVRQLVKFLAARYDCDSEDLPVYFSGSKGFHVLLELTHKPQSSPSFYRTASIFVSAASQVSGVTLDKIYDVVRIIRAPNTRHGKTDLSKIRVPWSFLSTCNANAIFELAKKPDFGEPLPSGKLNSNQLATDWNEADARTEKGTEVRLKPLPPGGSNDRIQRFVLDFITKAMNGELSEGERERTLFRAAAALSEFPTIESLVRALLTEPGEYAGLHPQEISHAIRTGISHGSRTK